jgi:hypothetical protein
MTSITPAAGLSSKGKAAVLLGSLLFIVLALSMVAGLIDDPMFGARARERLEVLQQQLDRGATSQVEQELRPITAEIGRERELMDRYVLMGIAMAVANPLLAIWLVKRRRSAARFVLWMTLAGLCWGLSLTGTFRVMQGHFLAGGLEDPRFRGLLGLCLFLICVLNGLLVAGIALRMARPKPQPAAG